MQCIHAKTVVRQCCGNVILRGERVASGNTHVRAACGQNMCKIRSLRFQMDGNGNIQTIQRLLAAKKAK